MKLLPLIFLIALIGRNALAQQPQETSDAQTMSSQGTYVITKHTSVPSNERNNRRDELYTIVHGIEILKVRYFQSTTRSAESGDFPVYDPHYFYDPDLSQVPPVGTKIRTCLMSKDSVEEAPIIALQPTPAPCMARIFGNTLHYVSSPNGPLSNYVDFEILSETATTASTTRAQSVRPRKDIPAIAKAANGAIVTIIMAANDKPIAQGTGFLVRPDGVIVTNYHVIETGDVAVVKFPDGTVLPVDGVLAGDKIRDLAIIKIHGKTFRTLTLGNSDQIQVGEEVVAIGNPLSLESTVSNGIISAMRTSKKQGGKFLQTTAPISPGSSGGPLFNMAGQVIGINTLYLEGGENLNFAIPINDAKPLLKDQFAPYGGAALLQKFPNEPETTPVDAPSPTTGKGAIPEINSPAYQSYQELLKSGDVALTSGTYACFDDDPQSDAFMVIAAHLFDKQTMMVMTQTFTKGVRRDSIGLFQGSLNQFSGSGGLFATLRTMNDYSDSPSQLYAKDVFEWGPDVLTMKTGIGELAPGEARTASEFKMQRSTGRYTEHTVASFKQKTLFTFDHSGRCIRIPIKQTPEEQYRSLK